MTRALGRRAPAAVLLAVLVAACQPLPQPFADDRPPAALIAVPDNLDIAVGQVAGEPRATADKLPKAVAQELVKHNIVASDDTASKLSYQLNGRIEEHADQPGKSVVTVFWQLRDARGNIVNERTDQLAAPTRDWADGNDAQVTQLAAASAAGFASLVSAAQPAPTEAPGGGRTRVAVRKISGAPGDGDNSLATSLTAVLKHADIELVDAKDGKPDVDVDCDVKLDPIPGNKQHVKIVWHVDRASGGEIGQVAQENDIPHGQLDGAWGDIAYSVAMAAADGIVQLVDRAGPAGKGAPAATAAAAPVPAAANVATPASISAATADAPKTPPVAGNIDSPEVNLPPVSVGPADMPKPLEAPPDVPVLLPYRGVPIPR
ncbi:MAG TPA: hypothetical protein VME45_10935 [Stellaceae bacterium]|nr:hypothetical protein [Stellaceae bacterium]